MKEFKHLSSASRLGGKGTEVCPVKIEIHKMLLLSRRDSVDEDLVAKTEMWGWYFWKNAMLHRKFMNGVSGKWKNWFMKTFFRRAWGKRRDLPPFPPKSFNEIWKDKHS